MSTRPTDPQSAVHDIHESSVAETPDDVAVLYTWANLHGAKYRDFSASRREYRAQVRHRNAEQIREFELHAQARAEAAALAADQAAQAAAARHSAARDQETRDQETPGRNESRERALHEADQAARVAAAERIEAARRAQAAALAEAVARREEREIAEASASARRQAERYTESRIADSHLRRQHGAELSDTDVPGQISDPYTPHPPPPQPHSGIRPILSSPDRLREHADLRSVVGRPLRVPDRSPPDMPRPSDPPPTPPRRPVGFRPDEASGVREILRPDPEPAARPIQPPSPPRSLTTDLPPPVPTAQHPALSRQAFGSRPAPHRPDIRPDIRPNSRPDSGPDAAPTETPRRRQQDSNRHDSTPEALLGRRREDSVSFRPAPPRGPVTIPIPASVPVPALVPDSDPTSSPAWLSTYADAAPASNPDTVAPHPPSTSVADTLQHSRERVASRWFALKGVFEHPGAESSEPVPVRQKETRTPVVAVFSLAGGVGKTSLVATLGRSLSSLGEKVLLADTTSHGLLPFYFGASELRHGTVRTFSPPSGSTDAPISLVSYDVDRCDEADREALAEDLTRNSRGTHRVLLDLNVSSGWIAHALARSSPTILVPVAPDMNSVISLQTVERLFGEILDADGRPLEVFYLLNQFDSSLPLHLDVREVLRRQLGDHLLPFVIRRAPAVSEALAEGMTVVDYSPESSVADDYATAATWLRTVAAPAVAGFRNVRWSER